MAYLNCKRLLPASASAATFRQWRASHGYPNYVPQWGAWIVPARRGPRGYKAYVVGYSRTEESTIWNHAGCLHKGN
jgi:hypothetical protein